jgi:hypothetical protein
VVDSIQRQAQRFIALTGDRVVEADALDEAPVAPIARIGYDDVEERSLLGAASGQPDDHHVEFLVQPKKDVDYMTEIGAFAIIAAAPAIA